MQIFDTIWKPLFERWIPCLKCGMYYPVSKWHKCDGTAGKPGVHYI